MIQYCLLYVYTVHIYISLTFCCVTFSDLHSQYCYVCTCLMNMFLHMLFICREYNCMFPYVFMLYVLICIYLFIICCSYAFLFLIKFKTLNLPTNYHSQTSYLVPGTIDAVCRNAGSITGTSGDLLSFHPVFDKYSCYVLKKTAANNTHMFDINIDRCRLFYFHPSIII